MTAVDVIVLVWVALSAAQGARRGLVVNALGLIGFGVGVLIGSRLSPHLLPQSSVSTWMPIASMAVAVACGLALQAVAGAAAATIRGKLLHGPLRAVDTAGGLAVGVVLGLALVWLAAVVAMQQPGFGLRHDIQRSKILPVLLSAVPASTVLNAIARFDPLPIIPALEAGTLAAPDPGVPSLPAVRATYSRVVRITGVACSLGVQGSGWVAARGLVVTNDHVIAGETRPQVEVPTGDRTKPYRAYTGRVVAQSATNDVAVLSVPGLTVAPLRISPDDPSGGAVAMLGYPLNGGLRPVAGRAGAPVTEQAPDVYGATRLRTLVPLRGLLQHGDSGGPVVDAHGRVVSMMAAKSTVGNSGFGVPLAAIRAALRGPLRPQPRARCVD